MFHLKDTESRETAPFGNVLISVFIGVRFFFFFLFPILLEISDIGMLVACIACSERRGQHGPGPLYHRGKTMANKDILLYSGKGFLFLYMPRKRAQTTGEHR